MIYLDDIPDENRSVKTTKNKEEGFSRDYTREVFEKKSSLL